VEARTSPRLALRRLNAKLALPAQEAILNDETKESTMIWESPALFTELKTWLNRLRYDWQRPVGLALLATIGLLAVIGLAVICWPGWAAIQPELPASTLSTGGSVQGAGIPTPPTQACPVTLPPAQPFIPPEPYPPEPPGPSFWYGDESLWTALPVDGLWSDLPHNPDGYTQKLLWWRVGYSWTEEPEPALQVTGHRLDDPTVSLLALPATNAFAPDIQSAMLTGVDFPTPGCWQITGRYAEAELSYIVQVEP
jgi:hypothetical protein